MVSGVNGFGLQAVANLNAAMSAAGNTVVSLVPANIPQNRVPAQGGFAANSNSVGHPLFRADHARVAIVISQKNSVQIAANDNGLSDAALAGMVLACGLRSPQGEVMSPLNLLIPFRMGPAAGSGGGLRGMGDVIPITRSPRRRGGAGGAGGPGGSGGGGGDDKGPAGISPMRAFLSTCWAIIANAPSVIRWMFGFEKGQDVSQSTPEMIARNAAEQFAHYLKGRPSRADRALRTDLQDAFGAHIARIDGAVRDMDQVALGRMEPIDATYPHRFQDARPDLMQRAYGSFMRLSPVEMQSREDVDRAVVGMLIAWKTAGEGIDPQREPSPVKIRRGLSLAHEVSEFSKYKLLCLLIQLRDGRADPLLVEQLKAETGGRVIDTETALKARLSWRHILEASTLVGNIDIIHANSQTAVELAMRESHGADPRFVKAQVMAAIERLGAATNSSRYEYDGAIERLKSMGGGSPNGGPVLKLVP